MCHVPMKLDGRMIMVPDMENDYLNKMRMCSCIIDNRAIRIIVYADMAIMNSENKCAVMFKGISQLYDDFGEYDKAIIGKQNKDGSIVFDTMIIVRESVSIPHRLDEFTVFTYREKYGMSSYETNDSYGAETAFKVEKVADIEEKFRTIQCKGHKNDYPVQYRAEDRFEITDNKIRRGFVISKKGTNEPDISAGYVEVGLNGDKLEIEVIYE